MTNTDDPVPDPTQFSLFTGTTTSGFADERAITLVPALCLGKLYATPAAISYLQRHGVAAGALISRHAFGDPGDLDDEDIAANAQARVSGARVMSSFRYGAMREVIWVITEGDRSATTLLLPDDY